MVRKAESEAKRHKMRLAAAAPPWTPLELLSDPWLDFWKGKGGRGKGEGEKGKDSKGKGRKEKKERGRGQKGAGEREEGTGREGKRTNFVQLCVFLRKTLVRFCTRIVYMKLLASA